MSQDDARLVGWLLWLATHTFFATRVLFQLNKSFKWKILCLICIFLTVILHHVSDCVILGQLGKHGCPDDFKFKLFIWETVWVLGSKQERFWNQKRKVWGHFGWLSAYVILGQLGKHGCSDDFNFKLLIWVTVEVLGSKQERFWNQKTNVWGHFGKLSAYVILGQKYT